MALRRNQTFNYLDRKFNKLKIAESCDCKIMRQRKVEVDISPPP